MPIRSEKDACFPFEFKLIVRHLRGPSSKPIYMRCLPERPLHPFPGGDSRAFRIRVIESPAHLACKLNGVASLDLMWKEKLRKLVGLLVIQAPDVPVLSPHHRQDILHLRRRHREVRGRCCVLAAAEWLENHARWDVQKGANSDTAKGDRPVFIVSPFLAMGRGPPTVYSVTNEAGKILVPAMDGDLRVESGRRDHADKRTQCD